MIVDPKYTKPVAIFADIIEETSSAVSVNAAQIEWSLCERNNIVNANGNFFVSFNLEHPLSAVTSGSTFATEFPEYYNVMTDKFVMGKINYSAYSEFIDARSIALTLRFDSGATIWTATCYSSTFTSGLGEKYGQSVPLLGDNIAFLFCDDINRPFSGNTVSDGEIFTSLSARTTWNTSGGYLERPGAVNFRNVYKAGEYSWVNSDSRTLFRPGVPVPITFPGNHSSGYTYDVPIGFVKLDQGYIIITHPSIVENFRWDDMFFRDGTQASTLSTNLHNVKFTANTQCSLSFIDLNTSFKKSAVCIANVGEFYNSNNHTRNREIDKDPLASSQPVKITELGMYNAFGEMVAIAKFSEPVSKGIDDILSFYMTIDS